MGRCNTLSMMVPHSPCRSLRSFCDSIKMEVLGVEGPLTGAVSLSGNLDESRRVVLCVMSPVLQWQMATLLSLQVGTRLRGQEAGKGHCPQGRRKPLSGPYGSSGSLSAASQGHSLLGSCTLALWPFTLKPHVGGWLCHAGEGGSPVLWGAGQSGGSWGSSGGGGGAREAGGAQGCWGAVVQGGGSWGGPGARPRCAPLGGAPGPRDALARLDQQGGVPPPGGAGPIDGRGWPRGGAQGGRGRGPPGRGRPGGGAS